MSSSEATKGSSSKKAMKPNKKAIKNMNKILNGRKKKNELEGLDDVIFSDNEDVATAVAVGGAASKKDAAVVISVPLVEKQPESELVVSAQTNKDNSDDDEHVIEHEEENEDDGEAAWNDDDDKGVSIDLSNTARLRKLRKTDEETTIDGTEYSKRLKSFYNERLKNSSFYGWAYSGESSSEMREREEDEAFDSNPSRILDEMLKTEYSAYAENSKPEHLLNDIIDIERIGQTPIKTRHNAVVQSIEFHPNNAIFFTAGLDKLVKIYTIRENRPAFRDNVKLLKQLYLEGMPVLSASFLPTKHQILASGMKKHLLSYDLISDKVEKISSHLFTQRFEQKIENLAISPDEAYLAVFSEAGYIMVLNAKTKQFLFEFKMNEPCTSVAFSFDSKYLFSAGKNGKIYQWDLAKRVIFDVMQDQGTQASNVIRVSPNGDYVATASPQGIVNLYAYNRTTHMLGKETIKEVQNLTTAVDTLTFNGSSEILLAASKWKKNAVRLVHLPTFNVFQNWPNFKTQLKFVTAAAFSGNGKYMALGNDAGITYIYNFKHYS